MFSSESFPSPQSPQFSLGSPALPPPTVRPLPGNDTTCNSNRGRRQLLPHIHPHHHPRLCNYIVDYPTQLILYLSVEYLNLCFVTNLRITKMRMGKNTAEKSVTLEPPPPPPSSSNAPSLPQLRSLVKGKVFRGVVKSELPDDFIPEGNEGNLASAVSL